jgi:hypothetical protein
MSLLPPSDRDWDIFLPETPGCEEAIRKFYEASGGTDNPYALDPQRVALDLQAEQENKEHLAFYKMVQYTNPGVD